MEKLKEPPIEIESLTRVKNREWLGDKKANVVACCTEGSPWTEKVRCAECGGACYHTPTSSDMKTKNFKMVCVNCVLDLEKYRKTLNKDQIKILEIGRGNDFYE